MKRPWKKILYERQPYPDNYIDPQKFLEDLVVSQPVSQVSYRSIILGSSIIIQQMTVVATFFSIYKYIIHRHWTAKMIIILDVQFLIIICIIIYCYSDSERPMNLYQTMKIAILFALIFRIAAPILQTLTFSFSNDTIHALAITFSFIHLVFHDYGYVNSDYDNFSGTLSLNAAMFTAVLLASRFKQIEMVFAFILLAIVSFSLFPQLARVIKRRSSTFHGLIVFVQWLCCGLLLYFLDLTLFSIYQFLVALLFILCPLWWVQMQRYKRPLRGPWDIAQTD